MKPRRAPPEIALMEITPSQVERGGRARIEWVVKGANDLHVRTTRGFRMDVPPEGALKIDNCAEHESFRLVARNAWGTTTRTVRLRIIPQAHERARVEQPPGAGKVTGPYGKLGLKPDASDKDVKAAYRSLVLKHHPDHGGNPDRFHEVQEAYGLLAKGANPSCWTNRHIKQCRYGGCWRCRRAAPRVIRGRHRTIHDIYHAPINIDWSPTNAHEADLLEIMRNIANSFDLDDL